MFVIGFRAMWAPQLAQRLLRARALLAQSRRELTLALQVSRRGSAGENQSDQ